MGDERDRADEPHLCETSSVGELLADKFAARGEQPVRRGKCAGGCGRLVEIGPLAWELGLRFSRMLAARNQAPLANGLARCEACYERWRDAEHRESMRLLERDQRIVREMNRIADAKDQRAADELMRRLPEDFKQDNASTVALFVRRMSKTSSRKGGDIE